ncbi:fungal-specific transcription factor domain-containing protein [Lasiosphaeria miniovina]|uniref:Fungal-specific transcription factor domain-containing protein n=1 Tax=Lasiosphaeria miniovina TaxID=1954250 RepID=A0AA40BEV1_9PEZI|nr:fungal-specific transcription factor domain-containing protein [Lasiosphaeria miniovina]KAK0732925.1 fungal-specific transcription factor domain-containing protein [Lasiosphaeria miniovina]
MQVHAPRYGGQPHPQSSPQSSHNQGDPADSDDGQLSGDDLDNDLDDHHDVGRSGKRKRPISVSCELCKQRKVKCDRGQPSCGWCSRNGAQCEYKERKKPGLRAGYGRELEQRLDKLEEILKTHSEILQTSFGGTTLSPVSRHSSGHDGGMAQLNAPPSVRGSNASLPSDHGTPRELGPPSIFSRSGGETIRTPQAETALFLQKPLAPIEFTLPPLTPEIQDSYRNRAGISPQHRAQSVSQPSAAAQEYYGTVPSVGQLLQSPTASNAQSQSQMAADEELPPYDLLYGLVDLYFKHINTWCPILHRKSTLESLFGPSRIDETDKILLHAVVATSLRYSTDARLTEESRRRFHDVSKQRVLLYGMEHSSVKALQALVILALDLCGSSNGPPGWNIMALITRSVVQLGLAVESNSFSVSPYYTSIYTLRAMILPEPRDFIEEESRRRLFWMVYLLDRYATIATAFEFALDDREIDRILPCRDDLWVKNEKVDTRWFRADESKPEGQSGSVNGSPPEYDVDRPENLGAFSYYIEILGILSKIHKFLKRPVDISALSDVETWQMRYRELDSMLTTWKCALPNEHGNMSKMFQPGASKTLNCGWVMLHATYHTAMIRLHSSAAYPTTRSPIFTPSYSASQRCHRAVENIAALGEFVVAHGLLPKLGPPFAFTLWVAARVLLVHGSTVERKLSPEIAFFVNTLGEMGRYWPVAARYSQLLTRVLDEHRESERQGGSVTPSSVKILADMRRTAFDLDFLISHQPRHTPAGLGGGHGAAGGEGGGTGWQTRVASVTPVRTPAPNELEYLDVFDFFNVPRLPVGAGSGATDLGGVKSLSTSIEGASSGCGADAHAASTGQFNITNFMVDVNHDWLFQQEGHKFLAA